MMVLSGVAPKIPAQQAQRSLTALPLITVPAKQHSDRLAVFYSGDGGWAGLDKAVSAQLAAAGVTVIGVNSRGYFWQKRSPDEARSTSSSRTTEPQAEPQTGHNVACWQLSLPVKSVLFSDCPDR